MPQSVDMAGKATELYDSTLLELNRRVTVLVQVYNALCDVACPGDEMDTEFLYEGLRDALNDADELFKRESATSDESRFLIEAHRVAEHLNYINAYGGD